MNGASVGRGDLLTAAGRLAIGAYVLCFYVLGQFEGLSRLSVVFAVAALGLVLAQGWRAGRLALPRFGFLPWLFAAYAGLSLTWAWDAREGLEPFVSLGSAVLGGFAAALAARNGLSWKPALWGAAAGAAVVAASTLPEVWRGGLNTRAAGIALNANAAGLLLSYAGLMIWSVPGQMPAWLQAPAAGLVLYAAAFTGSRKVLLCLAALVCLAALRSFGRLRRAVLAAALLAVAAAAVYTFSDTERAWEELQSLQVFQRTAAALSGEDFSYRTRVGMIDKALEFWAERPLLGWGMGQFAARSDFATYSHSNYAELLANLGAVGLALYYAFHATLLAVGARRWRSAWRGAAGSGLVLLLMALALDAGMVSMSSKENWLLLFFCAGLIAESEPFGDAAGKG